MIVGIGTDLLDVSRVTRELRIGGGGFRERVFTTAEAAYCETKRYPQRHFAARFCAKEALFKALPVTGRRTIRFTDVEVVHEPEGRPRLVLHGEARAIAERAGVRVIFLSLTHTRRVAAAHVVLET